MFVCDECGTNFTRLDNLHRHSKSVACKRKRPGGEEVVSKRLKTEEDVLLQPSTSTAIASSSTSAAVSPSLDTKYCRSCNVVVPSNKFTAHSRTLVHRTNSSINVSNNIKLVQSAFKKRICSYRITSSTHHNDFKLFLNDIKSYVEDVLREMLYIHTTLKVNIEVFASYYLETKEVSNVKSFNTVNKIIDQGSDVSDIYEDMVAAIISQITEFDEKDSGWALEKILFAEVNVNKFCPLGGSSYIKLPKAIEARRATVNVFNNDECCFAWAITSALFTPRHHPSSTSSYPHFSEVLNLTGMSFPVKLKDISKFESMNNISVNVYGLESKFEDGKVRYEIVGPLRYSRNKLRLHINLLYINNDDDDSGGHYCWIKDLSSLVSSQISKVEHKKYFCDGCLVSFSNQSVLKIHQQNDCNFIFSSLPSTKNRIDKFGEDVPGNILKFENFEKQIEVPFVVYADFESVLQPIDTCEPDPNFSFTNREYGHTPHSFAYLIKCSFDDSITKFVNYRGPDAAKKFVNSLESDIREIYYKYLKDVKPMEPLSPQEQMDFDSALYCNICDKPFTDGDVKVKDHCHITGKKRFGAAHSLCNLHYKVPNYIPIIFHNLSGYDAHLFIKELCKKGDKVDVVAQTKEMYVSFSKNLYMHDYRNKKGKNVVRYIQMRFIDSFRFLSTSLDNLSSSLNIEHFIQTKKYFSDPKIFDLMTKKGVFPYSFIDNISKLDTTSIPSKNDFYDKLNNQHISDDEYERANNVWNYFKCKCLGDYSDIYLKSDVLLLCDVFENFRSKSLEKYKLDPAHYFTSPGLSWDAMLKYTKIELELLTDIDMIHFFKKGIRGGISQCSERKCEANNKYLPNYNPDDKSTYIMYLDAVNLYGHSQSQRIATGNFKWLSDQEINEFVIENISEDSDYGYALEVDVTYPKTQHDLHRDLPFLVENIIPPCSKSKISKLIPNVNDKKHYICHYINLQQAIRHGLVVTKIHRILRFSQSYWLKKYIDLNTELRNNAKTKFEKDLYKLMNNAVFGKTMENVEKRRDIRLLTRWNNVHKSPGAGALIARPNFKECSIFNENLVAIHMSKLKIVYDKPIYIGFSILELSKTVLYSFYYDFIKSIFQNNASLLYTDTDSLIIKVETDDFYRFMKENPEKFDTSNYRVGNQFEITPSKPVIGRMKDEFPEDPIVAFYGTGAKAYYIQSLSKETKTAKGVKKNVIKQTLHLDDYKQIVEEGGVILRKMYTFSSCLHDIYTEVKNKIALNHYDNKRYVIPNTTKTLPWGHDDIEFYKTDPNMNVELALSALNEYEDNDNRELATEVAQMREHLTQHQNDNLDILVNLLLLELEN